MAGAVTVVTMDWVAIVGVASLGAAICVLAGAGVIGIFHAWSGSASTREYWFYPVGLLVGALLTAMINSPDPPPSQ
jgi:hypothetical protein